MFLAICTGGVEYARDRPHGVWDACRVRGASHVGGASFWDALPRVEANSTNLHQSPHLSGLG